jgi:hypothetical protein
MHAEATAKASFRFILETLPSAARPMGAARAAGTPPTRACEAYIGSLPGYLNFPPPGPPPVPMEI